MIGMANTSRRYVDRNGKMFIPMNVEGGTWNEHFITTGKLVCLGGILISAVAMGFILSDNFAPVRAYFIYYGLWALISFFLLRFIVFEERYYYKMYKQLKDSEVTTPAIFWDIATIKDTQDGAIMTYSDAKIAVMVKLERDTITGKPEEFSETHYDAISDFYKAAMLSKYNFIQLNVMEPAGNDPRFAEFDKLLMNNTNPNIQLLMEKQLGYIKNITRHTLYESDYFIFYTRNLSKLDSIISDVIDIIYKILDGAYIGYKVLRARDIIEFMKEEYGVKYFNHTDATLSMFKNSSYAAVKPFELSSILYTDGSMQEITKQEMDKLQRVMQDIEAGIQNEYNVSVKAILHKDHTVRGQTGLEDITQGFANTFEDNPYQF